MSKPPSWSRHPGVARSPEAPQEGRDDDDRQQRDDPGWHHRHQDGGGAVTHQDLAVEFYVEKLGFDKRVDVPLEQFGGRWIEVAPPARR